MIRVVAAAVAAVGFTACGGSTRTPPSAVDAAAAQHHRDEALVRARVWNSPATPIVKADFRSNPSGPASFSSGDEITCRFTPKAVSGTTPKFYCALADGQTVKIKYNAHDPELAAEVAATRLLTALGFFTDRMYLVGTVRCYGCPPLPFEALQCLARTSTSACMAGADRGRPVRFPHAVIERPLPGATIEAFPDEGWSWYELARVDASRGGSPRAQVDALRLLAMLLAHWDNKGENQRLVCAPGAGGGDGSCRQPVALIQDLGATFGPLKLDLPNWRSVAMWADPVRCVVSMRPLPYAGGTFGESDITEEGRQFALSLLRQLSDAQLRDLFVSSGVTSFDHVTSEGHDAAAWIRAFHDKVDAIAGAGPCPPAPR